MLKKGKKEKHIYGIVGLGRFGYALAHELAGSDAELVVIDRNEEKVREFREYTENAFVVKHLDKKTLMETGIQNCDIAVVCIGSQLDISILTTMDLVSLGIPKVVAKASSIQHGEILEKMGAEVVFPERDMAVRLAHRLEVSRVLDYIQLSEKLNISKLLVPNALVDKSVIEGDLRSKFGVNIIAIENKGSVIDSIDPNYVFKAGDILYISGKKDNLEKMSNWE